MLPGQRHAPGPGTDIQHAQGHTVRRHVQSSLPELLGLRARNEGPGIDRHLDGAEGGSTLDVLERLTGAPPLDQPIEQTALLLGEVQIAENISACSTDDQPHQALRLVAGQPGGRQRLDGAHGTSAKSSDWRAAIPYPSTKKNAAHPMLAATTSLATK